MLPPRTETELMSRARALAGLTLAELAHRLQQPLPANLNHHKGWVGHLLEAALGADAHGLAQPDFTRIGVELKTIPINRSGEPLESTFVCLVPLIGESCGRWEESWVARKLARVLWLPVEGERSIPLGERRIALPQLWSPTPPQTALLRQDWEDLTQLIVSGEVEQLNARLGQVLQIRPKGANRRARVPALDQDGEMIWTNPRGFYLRTSFTREIIQ